MRSLKAITAKKQTGNVMWLAIALLVVIGIMASTGVYFWKKWTTEISLLHSYVAKVETQLGIKNDAVSEFKASLAKVNADSSSQDVVLGDHMRNLEEHLKGVEAQVKKLSGSNQDWMLAETEYMLKMADLRIGMKQDVKGAVAMLKDVERMLKEWPQDDKGLQDVRLALTRDIASLELYREIDVPGTYAALVALGQSIEKLPLAPTKLQEPDAVLKGETAKANESKAPGMLSAINDTFAGYITIRQHDTAELKALLSTEQRLNFRDSVRLTLEQAETALLRGDQSTYDASLGKLRQWVLEYFVADNFKVQAANKKIEELSRVQVKQDLPSVTDSQQELKRYITDKMSAY